MTELLQFKQMLLQGLQALQLDSTALGLPCSPGFDVSDGDKFKQMLSLARSAGVASSGDSDPKLCSLEGECFSVGTRASFKSTFRLRTFDFGSTSPRTTGGDNIVVRLVFNRLVSASTGGGSSAKCVTKPEAKVVEVEDEDVGNATDDDANGDDGDADGNGDGNDDVDVDVDVDDDDDDDDDGSDADDGNSEAEDVADEDADEEGDVRMQNSAAGGKQSGRPNAGKRKRDGATKAAVVVIEDPEPQPQAMKKARSSSDIDVRMTSAAAASSTLSSILGTAVDAGNGTYSCSFTPPEGADRMKGGEWQLEVLLNGEHVAKSPCPIKVHPIESKPPMMKLAFGSIPTDGSYELTEGGSVATKVKGINFRGVLANGPGCIPMNSGVYYWELEVVKNDDNGHWYFGVCRPGVDLNGSKNFYARDDTWLMGQSNTPEWRLYCSTCSGTGLTVADRQMPAGSRVGLLLDLDNGGTLTIFLDNHPCGTVAKGLVGPLVPCISSLWQDKVVKIHGGLAPPRQPEPTKWCFRTFKNGNYKLSDDGSSVAKLKAGWTGGAIADGPNCTPMTSGKHYWELEVAKKGNGDGYWMFGVCRPTVSVNTAEYFRDRYETWLMWHNNVRKKHEHR